MCGRHEQFGDDILILGRHSRAALAAALLRPERIERGALDIAVNGNRNDHFLTFDQVFIVNTIGSGRNFGAARCGELIPHRHQFFPHHSIEFDAIGQNREQFFNAGGQAFQFTPNFIAAQCRQAMQPQFKNGADLRFTQAIAVARHFSFNGLNKANIAGNFSNWPIPHGQLFTRLSRACRTADDADDFVQIGHRDHKAKQDMGPIARFVQLKF